MAHKVLETREIPDEALYSNLKDAFDIKSWDKYFKNIFHILHLNILKILFFPCKFGSEIAFK